MYSFGFGRFLLIAGATCTTDSSSGSRSAAQLVGHGQVDFAGRDGSDSAGVISRRGQSGHQFVQRELECEEGGSRQEHDRSPGCDAGVDRFAKGLFVTDVDSPLLASGQETETDSGGGEAQVGIGGPLIDPTSWEAGDDFEQAGDGVWIGTVLNRAGHKPSVGTSGTLEFDGR